MCMRKRVTMLPRNRFLLLLGSLVALCVWLGAQTSSYPAQAPARPPAQAGAEPLPGETPNQPGNTVQVPAGRPQGQEPSREDNGVFVFKKQVEEVVLHATVLDDRHRLVTGLTKKDFQVFEDGAPQQITSFRREDIPVSLGIVIDNSGSMRDKRLAVNQAAVNLVRSSNPQDEVCIVNFNDDYYLDQDFTNQIPQLQEALEPHRIARWHGAV